MIADRLNKRITLKQNPQGQDSYGETEPDIKSWDTVSTLWASIEPISGREYFAAEQVNAQVTTRIRIRYRTGVTPAMGIVYGTRVFKIESVIDVGEKHRELQLMCEELI